MQSKETYADLSNKDAAWLKVAMAVAETSECRQRHGAVIVSGGSILGAGTNRDRNHPHVLGSTSNVGLYTSRHAEYMAIQKLNHAVVPRATLYVARVNRMGGPMMSRPCNKCWSLLMEYGIKEVVYTVGEDADN